MGANANPAVTLPVREGVWIGYQARANAQTGAAAAVQQLISGAKRFEWREWLFNDRSQKDGDIGAVQIPLVFLDATKGVTNIDVFNTQLLRFLSLGQPIVVVDRMDEIGFEQDQFELIEEEFSELLSTRNLTALTTIPGPMDRIDAVPWADEMEHFPNGIFPNVVPAVSPLRIAIIRVTKSTDGWQLDGRLLGGAISVGDKVLSSPSNRTAVVEGIVQDGIGKSNVSSSVDLDKPSDLEAIDISLMLGGSFFAETGETLSHAYDAPFVSDVFCVRLRWSGGHLKVGDTVHCKTNLGEFETSLQSIEHSLDPEQHQTASDVELQDDRFAEVTLRSPQLVALDVHVNGHLGGLINVSQIDGEGKGIGLISMEGYADQRRMLAPKSTNITSVQHAVTVQERRDRNGHEGGVLWFTGLSGSGKSTLAVALEARLFEQGYQVFVLDGDNVRQGLTANLGFSPDDRAENIRRVGEVTALFRQAGIIVISSFISPYRSDRDRARHTTSSGFHEVYIQAPVETCIARDPKGLYKKALKGDIRNFTGISAPYEEPQNPEIVVYTEKETIEACVDQLVNYVDRNFRL